METRYVEAPDLSLDRSAYEEDVSLDRFRLRLRAHPSYDPLVELEQLQPLLTRFDALEREKQVGIERLRAEYRSKGGSRIERLPQEVLNLIFDYAYPLPSDSVFWRTDIVWPSQEMQRLSTTCPAFRQAMIPRIWRAVNVADNELFDDETVRMPTDALSKYAAHVVALRHRLRGFQGPLLIAPSLRKLQIELCFDTIKRMEDPLSALHQICDALPASSPHLEELRLKDYRGSFTTGDLSGPLLSPSIRHFKYLRKIFLASGNAPRSARSASDHWTPTIDTLTTLEALEDLTISCCRWLLSEEDIDGLLKPTCVFPALKTLRLHETSLMHDLPPLLALSRCYATLETLYISRDNTRWLEFTLFQSAIEQLIRRMTKLRTLSVRAWPVSGSIVLLLANFDSNIERLVLEDDWHTLTLYGAFCGEDLDPILKLSKLRYLSLPDIEQEPLGGRYSGYSWWKAFKIWHEQTMPIIRDHTERMGAELVLRGSRRGAHGRPRNAYDRQMSPFSRHSSASGVSSEEQSDHYGMASESDGISDYWAPLSPEDMGISDIDPTDGLPYWYE